jgi:hypothetical protein
MADEITIARSAIKEVQDLRAELIKLSADALAAGKSMSSISTPSGLNKSNSDNSKAIADIEALKTKHISLSETIVKGAEKSRLAEIRLQQQREKAFDSFERNAKKEEALTKKQEGAYQRIQNSVNILTKTYNDLAIRKELGNTLTAKEEKQLTSLSARINTYQSALKNTDAQIGKNTRNVGNYASGYNALGNSINQLSREAPAFANSINTGFMALSNNFPALFDAIKGIREQNSLLVAQGKPTKSLFSQLVSGVFSLQTALSVGVTLLTLYGGTFVKWVQEVAKGKEGVDALKLRIEALNKSFEDTGVASAVKNVNELTINIGLAKKGFLDKDQVVKQYNETIGKTTGLVTSLDEAEKEITKNGDAYIKMTLYKAAANIALEEASKQVLEAEKSRRKTLEDFSNSFLDADLTQTRSREQYNAKQANLQRQRENRQKEEIKINEDAAKANIDIAKKFQEDAAKIASNFGFNFFSDNEAVKKKIDKSKRENLEALKEEIKVRGTTIQQIDSYIDFLKTEMILNSGNTEETVKLTKALKEAEEARKAMFGGDPTADNKIVQNISETKKAVKELSEESKQYLKSFVDEFASNSGFSETFKMLQGEIDGFGENWKVTFNAIAESAQEAFNFITEASSKNFDAEKERLQSQYDVSLQYAGDNKAAQEKLADDLEKKKKEIANREAKAKQKQALFNVAIDTAQAVVAVLPNFVLAGIVAALGAIQIATIASQKIPQYFMGGTHDGGLMMVNDAPSNNFKETIVYPNGNIAQPEGRNVVMNAPSGTKIYTPDQWNKIQQEKQIMDMLQPRGISMNVQQKEAFDYQAMDGIMNKYLGSITVEKTVIDKRGFGNYVEKQGSSTKINRSFASSKGFRFS